MQRSIGLHSCQFFLPDVLPACLHLPAELISPRFELGPFMRLLRLLHALLRDAAQQLSKYRESVTVEVSAGEAAFAAAAHPASATSGGEEWRRKLVGVKILCYRQP